MYQTREMVLPKGHHCVDEYHLVVQAQQGDEVAFEILYKRYSGRICLYLTRLVGNEVVLQK